MMKIICLLVVAAVVTGSEVQQPQTGSSSAAVPLPQLIHTISGAPEKAAAATENDQIATTGAPEASPSDDMAKAETFGFGYHKHIYVAPQYYGGYYGGYYPYQSYYPSYDYGYGYGYGYGYPTYY